jgi:hypothetical protein
LIPPRDKAVDAVYTSIERNDVPFQTILAGLAKCDPIRVEYHRAYDALEDARTEAVIRIGPISSTVLFQTVLRQSPRYRRHLKVAA